MNIVQSIHQSITQKINHKSKIDGRIWVSLVLLAYFGSLYLGNFFVPYQKIWGKLGIPTMTPPFADFRAILAGFECTRLGYDIFHQLPCDPWSITWAYPLLWMKFEWLGLNQSHTIIYGVLLAISFYLVTLIMIGKLNSYEAIIYSLILCSPPLMLLIERANVDIIMYNLLFLSLVIVSSKHLIVRFLGYVTLLIPSFLKLLPILSLAIILKEKKRIFYFYTVLLLSVFLSYYISILDQIKAINSFFSSFMFSYAFGYKILIYGIPYLNNRLGLKYGFSSIKLYLFFFVIAVFLTLFLIILVKILTQLYKEFKEWLNSDLDLSSNLDKEVGLNLRLDAFRMGSSLYLGTYLITSVYDYKFTFLIFTVPQTISWIKYTHLKLEIPSIFALIAMIVTLYASAFMNVFLIDEMINFLLCFYFLYAFVLTLPNWIKTLVYNLLSVNKSSI